ncbi:MAG: OmpW family outer membrane protein [Novosphingobium sp.]|uniref:OmpW/AlkL family protein n=1 Tax=Novosphingobium sp. TaxID=1874826 RepID=UPI0032BCE549
MKKLTLAAALVAATFCATPALAGADGKIEIKLLATGVLPDGKIDRINVAAPAVATALGTTPGTVADDNVVPTLAIEYYMSPTVSIETICCFTQHHVTGTGSIAGANIANHVLILPATVTFKLHADLGPIKPYVGAGPSMFFYFDEKPGTVPVSLGATSLKMDNKLGFAVQAGFDVPVSNSGMGISFDAKKYFMKTTTHFYAGTTEVLSTDHKLDPWVLSGGVYFRF